MPNVSALNACAGGVQLEPRRGHRHRRKQLAEPLPTLPRSHKPLPIDDGEIDRR
jgi:hypothetical protein